MKHKTSQIPAFWLRNNRTIQKLSVNIHCNLSQISACSTTIGTPEIALTKRQDTCWPYSYLSQVTIVHWSARWGTHTSIPQGGQVQLIPLPITSKSIFIQLILLQINRHIFTPSKILILYHCRLWKYLYGFLSNRRPWFDTALNADLFLPVLKYRRDLETPDMLKLQVIYSINNPTSHQFHCTKINFLVSSSY